MSYHYACIEFQQVFSKEEIRFMVSELAPILLQKQQENPNDFWCLEEITLELEDGAINQEQAVQQLANTLWLYVDHIQTSEGQTSLVVRSEEESDYGNDELAHEIAKHLFSKTGGTHFIMRSAAFDNRGGYSHQWIGYLKEGEVVLKHTDKYFREMFEKQPALMAA